MKKRNIIYVFFALILMSFLLKSSVLLDPANIINISDHGSDTREIWLGVEDYQTGKKVDPNSPDFWFTFDQPVDTDLIRDALRIESDNPESKCELNTFNFPEIPVFPITIENVVNAWEMGTVGNTEQIYPGDFNAFIFNDITNIPHIEGPIAAGNNIITRSFGVNQMTKEQAALVSGNGLQLLHGELIGDVYTEEYYEPPQSVTIHGNKIQGHPIAFKSAVTALCLFSRYLANEYTANADMTSQWGNTYFNGSDETINVFDINTKDLTGANYIEINVPYESIVLINVEGENFNLGNLGINVIGTDKQHVLWNFENAKNIYLSGISFPGSVLAPFAKVELNNGNLQGTVVAADLTGTGELHYFPFKDWEKFDIENRLYIRPVRKLAYDCEYRLVIENYALNQDGGCLGKKLVIPFKTIKKQESVRAFHRETEAVQWDYQNNRLNSFLIKEGINTEPEKMFKRYANLINLRPQDTLKLVAASKHTTADPNQDWTYYGQYFQNVRVDGFGYVVYEENGFARSAFGRFANELEVNTNPNISQSNALFTACASMNTWQPYPWQNDPELYPAPTCELVVASISDHAEAEDFKLMWRIDCGQSNLGNAELFYIDAMNNQIVYRQNKERTIGSAQPIDVLQYLGPDAAYIKEKQKFFDKSIEKNIPIPSDRYRREVAGTSTDYYALAMTKDSNYNDYTAQFNLKMKVGETQETPKELICNDTDMWEISDTISDPFFYSAPIMRQIIFTSQFYALYHKDPITREPWRGIDGTGKADFDYVFTPPVTGDEAYTSQYIFDPFNPKIETPYDFSNNDWKQASNVIYSICHEMTHGVFDASRFRLGGEQFRVKYTGEGGAINEGLAEIMNHIILYLKYNFIEYSLKSNFYHIFEDPHLYEFPSYYKGKYWLNPAEKHPQTKYDDLHTNCTILYYWFYLLSQGGQGMNEGGYIYDVKTIGLNEEDSLVKLASILLKATTELLPAGNATFAELRNATVAAADHYYADDTDFEDTIRNMIMAWDAVGVYGEVPQIKADSIFPAEKDNVQPWPVHFGCEFESGVNPDDLWLLEIAEKNFKDEDFEESDIIFLEDIPASDLQEPLIIENRKVKYYLKPYTPYYWRLRPIVYDPVLDDYTILQNLQVNSFTTNFNDFALKEEAGSQKQYPQIIKAKSTGFDFDFAMLPLWEFGGIYIDDQIFSLEGDERPDTFYAKFTGEDVAIKTEKVYERKIPATGLDNHFELQFEYPPINHLEMYRVDIKTGCDETSDPTVIDPSYLEYDYYFYFMIFDPELHSPRDPDDIYEEVGNYYFEQFAESADEKPYFSWNHLKGKYVPDMKYQLIIYPTSPSAYDAPPIFNDVVDYQVDTQAIDGYQLAGYQFDDQTANEKAIAHECSVSYLNGDNMLPLCNKYSARGGYGIKMVAPQITSPDNVTIDFPFQTVEVSFKQIPGLITVNDPFSIPPGEPKQLRPDYQVSIWDRDSDGNNTGDPEILKFSPDDALSLPDDSQYYQQDGDDVTLTFILGSNPHGYTVHLQAHRMYCPLGELAEIIFNTKLPAPNILYPNDDVFIPYGADEIIFQWNNDFEYQGQILENTPAAAYRLQVSLGEHGTRIAEYIAYTSYFEYDETTGICSISSKKFMKEGYTFTNTDGYSFKIEAMNVEGVKGENSEQFFEIDYATPVIIEAFETIDGIYLKWSCEYARGYFVEFYKDGNKKVSWSNPTAEDKIMEETFDREFRVRWRMLEGGEYDIYVNTERHRETVGTAMTTIILSEIDYEDTDPTPVPTSDPNNNDNCTPVTDEPNLIGPGVDSGYLFDLLDADYNKSSQVEWSVWKSRVPYGIEARWGAVKGATKYEIKVVGLRETRDVWEYYYDMIVTQMPPVFSDSKIVDAVKGQIEYREPIRDLLTDQTDGTSNYLFLVVVDAYNDCTSEPLTSNLRVTRTP